MNLLSFTRIPAIIALLVSITLLAVTTVDAKNNVDVDVDADDNADVTTSWIMEIPDHDDDDNNDNSMGNNNNNETASPSSSWGGNNETLSEVASDLSQLLDAHNLTTWALAKMYLGTYFAQNPRDSDQYPDYWKAEIVTPDPQGVNGSLIQAVLFTNGFRNSENEQRVLSFAGVQTQMQEFATPEGACLAAEYGFKGTAAESAWQHTCIENGFLVPDMSEWASQVNALIEEVRPTFLTGHKLGCDFAKSAGILNPDLPVVCFAATGTLTQAWIDAYPGLADAIDNNNNNNTNTNENENENSAFPENDAIYVLQTYTDPHSNCIHPPPSRGSGLANVCYFHATVDCDLQMTFDYGVFSRCVQGTSSTLVMFTVPIEFEEEECVSREYIGEDFSNRICPHEAYYYGILEETSPPTTTVDGSLAGDDSSTIKMNVVLHLSFQLLLMAILFVLC